MSFAVSINTEAFVSTEAWKSPPGAFANFSFLKLPYQQLPGFHLCFTLAQKSEPRPSTWGVRVPAVSCPEALCSAPEFTKKLRLALCWLQHQGWLRTWSSYLPSKCWDYRRVPAGSGPIRPLFSCASIEPWPTTQQVTLLEPYPQFSIKAWSLKKLKN